MCWVVLVIIIFFFIGGIVVLCNVFRDNIGGLMVFFYIVYFFVGICEWMNVIGFICVDDFCRIFVV